MAKIVLNPVTNGNTLSVINANFDKIEAEFQDKVAYRDNPVGETNTIKNDLDLDGNNIFNVNEIHIEDLYVQGTHVPGEDLAAIPELIQDVTDLQNGLAQTNINVTNLTSTVNSNAAIEDAHHKSSLRTTGAPINPIDSVADRANKYLVFDAAGQPKSSAGTGADIGLRADLAASNGATLVGFNSAGATVDSKMREVLKSGNIPQRPVFLEQFVSGFFGRGMLTAETINITTEQFLAASSAVNTNSVTVTNATNFLIGGCVSIRHDNGRYGTYFVDNKAGNVLTLKPSLRYAVSTNSKIERTWFNRAHPGKFYMRELAQRAAYATENLSCMPVGNRAMYTNFANNATLVEDKLTVLGGASINYFPASNLGSTGDTASPVRFPLGETAFISTLSVNAGAESGLFAIRKDGDYVAQVVFSASFTTPVFRIDILDETGKTNNEVLGTYTIPNGNNQLVSRVYTIPFNSRSAKYLKVRIVCASSPAGSFNVGQIDVFEAPSDTGFAIAKRGAVIVALGDSWIGGDLVNTPEREPITQQLALELPDATIINAGVGGNKIWEEIARFDTDVAPHNPDYVLVNTGTNETYNPASAIFDPNSIDFFIYSYRILINKILAIGAKPIIIGVPALAESDGAFVNWELNDKARKYASAFFMWEGVRPLALGARSGLESYRTDANITTGSTPSVAFMRMVDLTYAVPSNITNLLGGVDGQLVTLTAKNSNVTLQPGTFQLAGNVAVNLTTNSTITLKRLDPTVTTGWVEVARSITAAAAQDEVTFTDASTTTPSVTGLAKRVFVTLNYATPATTITNFTGGVKNQELIIRSNNGNVTFPTAGVFKLTGGVNVTLTTDSVITFLRADPALSSSWYEVSRSIK